VDCILLVEAGANRPRDVDLPTQAFLTEKRRGKESPKKNTGRWSCRHQNAFRKGGSLFFFSGGGEGNQQTFDLGDFYAGDFTNGMKITGDSDII